MTRYIVSLVNYLYLRIAITVGVCARNEVKPNMAVRRTNIPAVELQLDGHLP